MERNWDLLADELRGLVGNHTGAAAVRVESVKMGIDVYPRSTADRMALHHNEDIVDFCRCKRLNSFVMYDNVNERLKYHIF